MGHSTLSVPSHPQTLTKMCSPCADVEVLTKIYMALGTPHADPTWAGLRHMPGFVEFQPTPAPGLRKLFPASIVGVSGAGGG